MSKQKTKITVSQLFIMLIISRVILNLTYNPFVSSESTIWDHVISLSLSFIINFLLMIPIYILYKRDSKMTIADHSTSCFKKLGTIFILIYAAYYLFVCCYTLSLFNVFISNVMDPSLSITTLSIAIILTSCYGAFKGLEGLARASSIIMFIILTSIIFLIIAIFSKIDMLNYAPFLYQKSDQLVNYTLFSLSRMSCIPAMGMLLPFVKGNVKKGMISWNIIVHSTLILLILVMIGTLGEYSKIHIFPIYAVTSIAEIGTFRRLDALYLGIFTAALFVKISLFLYLFSLSISKTFNNKVGKASIFLGGTFVAIIGITFSNIENLKQLFYDTPFVLTFTLVTAVILPTLLLIVKFIKRKDVKLEKNF